MSTRPEQHGAARPYPDARASEMEAIAEQLVALVEEFETALSQGQVPPKFAERLARLREAAEQLV